MNKHSKKKTCDAVEFKEAFVKEFTFGDVETSVLNVVVGIIGEEVLEEGLTEVVVVVVIGVVVIIPFNSFVAISAPHMQQSEKT